MKRNPAGAGYDDDPGGRLRAAAEGTCLCRTGLSSYPSRVAVLKALTGDVRRPENVAPTLRTPYVPQNPRVTALCQLGQLCPNWLRNRHLSWPNRQLSLPYREVAA
jgi:hypothetical protein